MGGPWRSGSGRGEPNLDPVRWRHPRPATLLRLVAVAALLVTAATMLWLRPPVCAPGTAAASATPSPAAATAAGLPPSGVSSAVPTGPGGPVVPRGSVGVPVRLAEPAALKLVHVGDRVDLLRVDEAGGPTTAVAAAALVLGVTGVDDTTTGGVLLALRPAEAQRAVAGRGYGFAVLIRPD